MNPGEFNLAQTRYRARLLSELDDFAERLPGDASGADVLAAVRAFVAGLKPEELLAPHDFGMGDGRRG